ncbi:MAG: tRNA uridine-5-carboxymethylaminomethyl(34) synthesis GTPase MnmE [Xanthomarina sp.]|uniref:tRNA modification GTPase MnmE n=3 Tax=Xanthomarina gelatinilytica TaxID=1137281 RepID=M7N7B3_9FLAO|nr:MULTISPECIES: tRNA uridine-5-carboxymethylaminomethyl(34) synthesis GTPase MnmE [Xanthomarina]EMQ94303.1 GTPase and tRNA-U34 5-formylation enzyme TrmE [Xanthomarina gelatinilytica]MAL23004.1 tRNA uridine-5-carboxymethylaminomethyl(34) synthesis GTPase MnmE [Xanthomarina sp.]MBF62455.1 tRNA uridine-5-carboxymethylaminomethyl(34) synthesis GTPase MnmE [Xanthomarina sp.]HAB26944.1 tRNA uridine-5-carboxymethylaminomethyl(34) synthesis GTPase MnmE [Xanthomarina gelatinilytica]|tara:strand:- start:2143 stop:3531 length:1389 start_codon:yes stop_codon:yes gene_type:complete
MTQDDTIIALATASGAGAIAVIRLSGKDAIAISSKLFKSIHGKDLTTQQTHTIHLGHIMDGNRTIDEVLVSLFKNPQSYTGEDVVEISCHGSVYIQQEIIQLFLRHGCRMADAGEFTLRAFLNGKLDLSQAEAVADLIASDNEASHQIAMQQMRGGFSGEIAKLREELLNFASLIELELDFAEEDVEFADRTQFKDLVERITFVLKRLIDSFAVGNVIKNGIPVAIVGEPNVGKSTLLNALLNEERAIVSDVAGTTRDTIEDEISIGGIGFRFIDTAGIRDTKDVVESIGIKKTFEKIDQAQVVIYLFDATQFKVQGSKFKVELEKIKNKYPLKPLIVIANKIDQVADTLIAEMQAEIPEIQLLSAKTGFGVEPLTNSLLKLINTGALRNNETIVTNTRHYDALLKAFEEMQKVKYGLETGISGDLLAIDIREALYQFGLITGNVTNDELLGNIFANFCIGK